MKKFRGRSINMSSSFQKKNRLLNIFFRAIKGEDISIKRMAQEYQVSEKSIRRDINEIKDFLSENRDLVGNIDFEYYYEKKAYRLNREDLFSIQELIGIIKVLIGSRAFGKIEILDMITKLKKFTSYQDRQMIERLIDKEIYHYNEVNRDCESVIENLWDLTRAINENKEVTIFYYKMERKRVERRLKPLAIIFSEYYFYLIAYDSSDTSYRPKYYRVDRMAKIVNHRSHFKIPKEYVFDEGALREKIQYMFPGEERKIRFEFRGPSVQAILDRIPTARVIRVENDCKVIEAKIYGEGIKMYLLSQGSWVKVLSPPEFVEEIRNEIESMRRQYETI